MSSELSTEAERTTTTRASRRRFSFGWLVLLGTLAGLGGWLAVRVRAATETKRALAAEREDVAKAAAAAPQPAALTGAPLTVTGIEATWQPEIELEGTLQPVREADLAFKVGGQLASIKVKLGQRVSTGTPLATLDGHEARAQLEAAEAQARAAEAQLALAEDTASRTSTLVGTGAASQASGVQTSGQRSLAAAQRDSAKAQLALAEVSLKNHVLTAPFPGLVTKVPAGPGAFVGPGQPLFHVQDTSVLKLSTTVSEADAPLVRPGSAIEIRAGGRVVRGEVVAVLQSVDPATRRVPVEAQIKNDGTQPLLAGAFVRATVQGLKPVPALRLPQTALRPGSQNELMVVKDRHQRVRRVTFVRAPDGALLVRAGLEPGEAVVRAPSPEAQDGEVIGEVELKPVAGAPGPGPRPEAMAR